MPKSVRTWHKTAFITEICASLVPWRNSPWSFSEPSHSVGFTGRVISPTQRPLTHNAKHSKVTSMYPVGFFLKQYIYSFNYMILQLCICYVQYLFLILEYIIPPSSSSSWLPYGQSIHWVVVSASPLSLSYLRSSPFLVSIPFTQVNNTQILP
jgi:hypothetical protein